MLTVDGKAYENSFEMLLAALNQLKYKNNQEKESQSTKAK